MKVSMPKQLLVAIILLSACVSALCAWERYAYAERVKVQFTAAELGQLFAKTSATATDEYIVLNMWATWCGPCIKEIPELNKLVADAKGNNIKFIAATNEKADEVVKWMAERASKKPFKFDYQIITDSELEDKFASAFASKAQIKRPEAIPQHYILKRGQVVYHKVGTVNEADLKQMRAALGL